MQEFVVSVFTKKIDDLFMMQQTNVFAIKNAAHIGPLSSDFIWQIEVFDKDRGKSYFK